MVRTLGLILLLPLAVAAAVDYTKDVKPILAAKCFSCHGPKQAQSGLRLDLRQTALRGGDYGAVIVPGKSGESKLIARVEGSKAGLQMPPTGPLADDEIATLRKWVDEGAEMPGRANDAAAPAPRVTDPKLAELISAIRRHDDAAVRAAITPELARAADAAGTTALMHAANGGTVAAMEALIAAGAAVNAANDRGATAAHWAAADLDKLKLLKRHGADFNARTVEGRTPLYVAAGRPSGAPVVEWLLANGADPNAATVVGATPLFPAAGASAANVRALLAKGANPRAKSATGATPLMAAAFENHEAAALLVAAGAEVSARTKRGETALANAANQGNLETARLLLEKGANVNARDYRGYTPLMHAAYYDGVRPELIRLLLEKGADPSASGEGETVYGLAAKRGNPEVLRLLEAAGGGDYAGAVRRAMDLLVKTSPAFVKKGGCNSCHNQMLPAAAQGFARARGLNAGETIHQMPAELNEFTAERIIEHSTFGPGSLGYELFGYALNGRPADARIDAMLYFIQSVQRPEGYWRTGANRPPLSLDDYTSTAMAIHALRAYGGPAGAAATARARSWLLEAKPATTQERAFHLLGLAWSGAGKPAMETAAAGLRGLQSPDGGWSQLPNLASDAYATGLALYALYEGGTAPRVPEYRAGLGYLMRTQAADGTWHVRTRSLPFQPYFESGYPYGHDQWISAAGTSYAAMALAAAVEPARASK